MAEELIQKIFAKIKKTPDDPEVYEDAFSAIRNMAENSRRESSVIAHDWNARLREEAAKRVAEGVKSEEFFDIYKRTLLFDAPSQLDSYLLYLEIGRKPSERFYQPRRKRLKQIVDALQKMADGELDELFISLPPRVGKTTLLMFFVTWLIGRKSEPSNLYSAYSDTITKAFYDGVLEVITDPVTYKWNEVFPNAKVVQTNAQEEKLNINRQKRYATLTCRSLYGTLNGACDCNGFLISDDLIGGIEEALNKDRLYGSWSKVDNNLLPRAKENAKILWCGTRWSIVDPTGKRLNLLEEDESFAGHRYEMINIPALDENDESNFDYDYGVGFTTEFYHKRRASFERNNDMASWLAQYMGVPIEREGALFTADGFRYYNGTLPKKHEPDRIFMAVDPAFGGGDYVAAPVCFQYGEDIYVHDVVYNNGDKTVTQPLLVKAIRKNGVNAAQFETTKSTDSYREEVDKSLRDAGIIVNITSKAAGTTKSKEERIYDKAPEIREHMLFRETGKRSKEYEQFMQNVFSFVMLGKNKHDDAPDSLAMAMDMAHVSDEPSFRVFKRFF